MSHVVAICGMMGSGKSTLLELLSSQADDCVVLEEDAYNPAPLKSIAEVQAWWDRGGNVDEFDLSSLVSALEAATAATNRVVFLETQFGRLHAALRPHIDLQVWIDVDADIAFARKVAQLTRQMLRNPESASSPDSLTWLAEFCDSYVHTTRQLFARQRTQVGQQSDERVNGSGTPQEVCERLQALLGPFFHSPQSSTMAQETAR